MKTVIIHGQSHKGSSYHVGRMLADRVADENEITEFFLPNDLNHFCLGCYKCLESEDKCPFYEEKQVIMNAIEKCELLVVTTPTYCMLPSAALKSFFDLTFTNWMPHRPKKYMFTKKAVVVSTMAGSGAKPALASIKKALFYWGIPYIKTYGVAVQATSWAEVREEKRKKIFSRVDKLERKLRRTKKPRVGIKTRFIFMMMRMTQRGNMGASPHEKEYWEKMGWLEKERPWKK